MQMYIILFIKGNKKTFSAFNNLFDHDKMRDIPESVKVFVFVSIQHLEWLFPFWKQSYLSTRSKKICKE